MAKQLIERTVQNIALEYMVSHYKWRAKRGRIWSKIEVRTTEGKRADGLLAFRKRLIGGTFVASMEASQKNSANSVEKATIADEKMQLIIHTLHQVDDENHAVADATQQQVSVIKSIDEDILQLMDLNQLGVQNLQQTQEACDSLQQEFTGLNDLVGKFKV